MSKIKADKQIAKLKEYLAKEPLVLLAFIFGSRSKDLVRKNSDWDIAVYFQPKEYMELETENEYPKENKIWSDLIDILSTDNMDFVVLNRARPELVFTILNTGIPLALKDRELYLDLLSKTHYEAVDFRQFAFDFWKISERAESLAEADRFHLLKRLKFLEKEWAELDNFKNLTQIQYQQDSNKRRNVERWIENLIMASLDIAKIILAADKELIPDSYKATFKYFMIKYFDFKEESIERFSRFVELRNIVVHEYLDIRWQKIKNFIKEAKELYPKFIKKIKEIIGKV